MASVPTSSADVVAPRGLIVPLLSTSMQTATAPAGYLGISGAKLVFFDGSQWRSVTST